LHEDLPVVDLAAPPTIVRIDLTRATDDLFQRIRNGFAMPDIDNELVLSHQQWYMGHPDYLRRMLDRSSLYMHYIVEELEKRGMPTELALLPMVESAYNPMALSRSQASGLWQFIPSTGKHFNLDQTWWKDDRRDIVASTNAALDYLQSIYDMHGDWHLALASYNWGEGAVGRAIAKNQAEGLATDYLSLDMPNETRNYVPKLQALKNIFRNPTLMASLDLPKISNRPYFGTVTQSVDIDVNVAAKLAGMPLADFVALNPSHNRPVIKADTPLVLPADKVDTFVANLKVYTGSRQALSAWQSYTARPGERLDRIAKRFGMSLTRLKEVNGIKDRSNKIRRTTTLLVAGHSDAAGAMVAAATSNATARGEPKDSGKQVKVAVTVAARETYVVRKGDSLYAIAKRYGVPVAELKRLNNLRFNRIAAGDRLIVAAVEKSDDHQSVTVTTAARAKSSPATNKSARSIAVVKRYTIKRGDTLTSIARQFKVSADDLLRWNRVSPRSLQPGQTLTIQLAQTP
ncbi:MAG: LysM peptidoglycan-binding domain-containing protein, partial [Propionivibrio sp.]